MEQNTFVQDLNARIAKYDLLCHPFYRDWSEGKLTREDLRQYASEYFHHVAAFPTYLSAFHSRLEDGELRRAVLRNLADEEVEGRAHTDLWLDFAEGMGASAAEVRSHRSCNAIGTLIGKYRDLAATGSVAEVLASLYAYESQVPRVATEKARGLMQRYGADAKTCGYFALHAYADVQHSRVWAEELVEHLTTHLSDAEAALNAAETAARWLWESLDGIQELRHKTAAACA